MSMKMLITDAGLAEVVNAEQSGTAPVELSYIALGTGQYTPTADMTALKSEFKRFDSIKGGAITDNVIHISLHDNSKEAYTVYELGVFTANGTLFAVYSQTTPIVQKAADAEVMLVTDFVLSEIDVDSITIGDTNFILNPATTETAGLVELATEAEAKAGTDETKAITPAALDAAIEAHDNIVHKSGNETVGGSKTFTHTNTYKADINFRSNIATDLTEESAVDELWYGDRFVDKNGIQGAAVQYHRNSNGYAEINMQVKAKSSNAFSALTLVQAKDGTSYATAPTPASGDNSTKIATTAFVNNKANNYLPLAGGKMEGVIVKNGSLARNLDDVGYISMGGGETAVSGGGIWLYPDGHIAYPGYFLLRAAKDGEYKEFTGNPNGLLQWDGKNIVRSVNGTNADTAGNVAITAATVDALPVSGGAMTNQKSITRDVNNSYLGLHGGTGENNDGAQLDLCGANHSSMPGTFQIHARNADTDKILRGQIDGTLTWDSKTVLTNSTSMPNNSSGVVINGGTDHSSGGYIRAYGKDNSTYPGWFTLGASDGTNSSALRGLPDGTLTWNGKPIAVGDTTPTGTVIAFAANSAPSGFLLCNGAAVNRTTYADLFAAIGTTYGAGDGSTTFALPNLTDKFIQGSGTAGTSKAAGLPNITGNFTGGCNSGADSNANGAFAANGTSSEKLNGGSWARTIVNFNASRSSGIYGKSSTVQPPALTMRYYIKY